MRPTSVCVVNYNGERYLPRTLQAISNASCPFEEILVVDNASSDASLRVLQSYPSIRVISLPENRGPGPARNAGSALARSARVLFVDNDVRLQPDTAERLAQALDSDPEAALAVPRVLYSDRPDTIQYEGADTHFLGHMILNHADLEDAATSATVESRDSIVTACFLMDRDRWGHDPPFDESFEFNYEDHDFGVRTRVRGHRILSVGTARVRHGGGTEGLSHRPGRAFAERRVYCLLRNRWQILAKCYSARTLLLLSPILAFYEVFQLLGMIRKGWLAVWLRGLGWMARHPRELWTKRLEVQRTRRAPDRVFLGGGSIPFTRDLTTSRLDRAARGAIEELSQAYWSLIRCWI